MQIQISWLLQKPTDLDLHCLQRQGISGFSRTRDKILLLLYLADIFDSQKKEPVGEDDNLPDGLLQDLDNLTQDKLAVSMISIPRTGTIRLIFQIQMTVHSLLTSSVLMMLLEHDQTLKISHLK